MFINISIHLYQSKTYSIPKILFVYYMKLYKTILDTFYIAQTIVYKMLLGSRVKFEIHFYHLIILLCI